MDRDTMIAKVKRIYHARIHEDPSALDGVVAAGAPFEFNGEKEMTHGFPGGDAKEIAGAIAGLNESLKMKSCDLVEAVAENNRLAAIWDGEFYFTGHPPFKARLFNRWTFDADGLISSGVEFFDTALLVRKMREAGLA